MKQIIVHCTEGSTRVALLENEHLAEYYVDRPVEKQLVGNIYKGRIVNVLPGMQAAFVDIGQGKNAFLYIDDLLPAHLEQQPKIKPSITKLLTEGDELLVQVSKEPLGTKGARVTTHFSMPGRWVVYMPNADYVGVSRKIESEPERERLKEIGERIRRPGEGLILRTVAEGESEQSLQNDLNFLRSLWAGIAADAGNCKAPCTLFRELDMIQRLVRDIFTDQVEQIMIDDPQTKDEIVQTLQHTSPKLIERVHLFKGDEPIFQRLGVQDQLEKLFRSKVWLRNGGHLHVDQTEALTVIDVNTGKYIGTDDLEQTVFDTNMEAAVQIARLIRLRDIGGIIIVDFIDMTKEENRQKVVELLEEQLKQDRTKALVVGFTKLGLLEMTRKKVRDNMDSQLFDICAECSGIGKVYSKLHPLYYDTKQYIP